MLKHINATMQTFTRITGLICSCLVIEVIHKVWHSHVHSIHRYLSGYLNCVYNSILYFGFCKAFAPLLAYLFLIRGLFSGIEYQMQ